MSHIRNPSPSTFHPDVSHSEFFPADIPPGCLTSGSFLRRHSTRISHIRNPSPPTFHPDVSHPEFFPADIPPKHLTSGILLPVIPPGCLTSGSLLRRHSTRMSHIRNFTPDQRSTSSGCLTSRILLRRHSTQVSHTRNSVRPTFHLFLHP